jgi:hypothetical protein
VPEESSAQLHLFQMGGYSYQLLVTNLPTLRIGPSYPAVPTSSKHCGASAGCGRRSESSKATNGLDNSEFCSLRGLQLVETLREVGGSGAQITGDETAMA